MTPLKGLVDIFRNSVINAYKPIISEHCRTGTKIAVTWLVFSGILIVWLVIGVPVLTIFYPVLSVYAANISSIIIALIGGASVVFSTSEIRKTVENVKNVQREPEVK